MTVDFKNGERKMDITRAVEILNAVAQGVNPFTGEVVVHHKVY